MALSTRCPQCAAVFKVVADQLRVRNGLVRCGECATVFDGRACLVEPPQTSCSDDDSAQPGGFAPPPAEDMVWPPAAFPRETQAESLISDPIPEPVAIASPAVLRGRGDMVRQASVPVDETPQDEIDEPLVLDAFDNEREPAWAQPADEEPGIGRQDDEPSTQDEPYLEDFLYHEPRLPDDSYHDDESGPQEEDVVHGEVRYRHDGETDDGHALPDFLDTQAQGRRRLIRRLWGLANFVGVLVLAAQAALVYRTQLANAIPALRPALQAACQPLGCTVGYERRIERISVSASSLQPQPGSEARDDGVTRLMLNVVLRNRYGKAQEWPALALDLTDMSDTVVVRKVLLPEVYLPTALRDGPFAAGAEVTLAIPLELSGVQISGYQLDKFFP